MKTINILSWNVNGLRAVINKGFMDFLEAQKPDILGIQETKLHQKVNPHNITIFDRLYDIGIDVFVISNDPVKICRCKPQQAPEIQGGIQIDAI